MNAETVPPSAAPAGAPAARSRGAGLFVRSLRVAWRLPGFLAVTSTGILEHAFWLRPRGRASDPRASAAWLRRWSTNSLRFLGIRVTVHGAVPTRGLVVSNHLGYLDIPVLASTGPMIFVSKADVERWPFMGSLARCGGTLFLRREQRSHVAEVAQSFRDIVQTGTVITIFPEGTSSGGDDVLPFRSSLLEPPAANGWPVTPACVHYDLDDGVVSEDVAYWREMVFGPHFVKLLSKRRIRAQVRYGTEIQGISDRKELARRLRDEVVRLHSAARASH